jgi:hypothetical protein
VVADLTEDAARFVRGRGDGLPSAFVPHATAGLLVDTGADNRERRVRLRSLAA